MDFLRRIVGMSKSKSKSSKGAAMPETPALNKVKSAAVTKPAQASKAKNKEIAKQVVAKDGNKSKHKKVKEPTPESELESESEESDSEESASDASADASESGSEAEVKATVKNGKANGNALVNAKAVTKDEDSDEDSSSSASSDNGSAANGVLGIAPSVTKAAQGSSESDGSDGSDAPAAPAAINGKSKAAGESSDESESSESDEDNGEKKALTTKKPVTADQLAKKSAPISPEKTSEIESDGSEDDSDDSEESSESSEEETEPKRAASKRKAEEAAAPAVKKAKTGFEARANQGRNLFVGSLSWNVDEQWLTSEFEEFGELTGVRVITDHSTGRSKGCAPSHPDYLSQRIEWLTSPSFGYVEFANAADAARAHAAKQGADLDGRKINVDFATQRNSGDQKDRTQSRAKNYGDQTSDPTDTLWVGNISFKVDQDQLSTAFQEYGTILGVRLPTDRETGSPKGFGYVTFSSTDEAKAAMDAMQGADLEGRTLRLDFSQPRPSNGDSPARGGRGGGRGGSSDRGRGGFGGRGGGRGGFGDRGGRGGGRGARGGRGGTTNRGGFGDFSGRKTTF